MGVIDTVNEVASLVQKLDNMDLLKRMVELQEQVYELVGENRDLKEQNRTLTEKLTTRGQMAFRKNSYWKGDDGPYCPRCFDAEGLSVRMIVDPGWWPQCPKCNTQSPDENTDTSLRR